MLRICFATPLARPLLDASFVGDFGGAEVRAVNFAKGLDGYDDIEVAMLLSSHRRETQRFFDGIRAVYFRQPGPIEKTRELPRDHTFYWRVAKIAFKKWQRSWEKRRQRWRRLQPRVIPALRKTPADVLCVFGVHHHAADVVATAQATQRRSLLFLASDTDLDERYAGEAADAAVNDYGQHAFMCRFALQHADRIIAQTPSQQALVWSRFGRRATVIRNPIHLQSEATAASQQRADRFALWVGRADTFSKRADKCFQLAATCPEVNFVAILNRRDNRVYDQLLAQRPNNVSVIEHVPYAEIDNHFRQATMLINTSDAEGFPNAFLQAGKFGVPVVSLRVDPGGMLSQHQGGLCAEGDMERMRQHVVRCWEDALFRERAGSAMVDYVRQYHEHGSRVAELRNELLELVGSQVTDRKAA